MPHVAGEKVLEFVAPAAISGVTSLIGGSKAANANKKATAAQLQANQEALAYQKEQDAKAEARQALIDQREEQRYRAMEAEAAPLRALRSQLLGAQAGRFGFQLPRSTGAPSSP